MKRGVLEDLASLHPLDSFQVEVEAVLGEALVLPDMSELLAEESFAECTLTLESQGVRIQMRIEEPFQKSVYPHYEEGDSLELFIDTRDLKTAGFMTQFCHHFVILPEAVNGVQAQEVTRFRTEDAHPLCRPTDIEVRVEFYAHSYQLAVYLPEHCLHGYDPASFHRLGFTYRMNRAGGAPQHFALSSLSYSLIQHPRYWATIVMRST